MDNKKYCLKPGYVLREIAGEHLAIPVTAENSSDIVVLNPVSAILWTELEGGRTIKELTDKICENFDITPDEAQADIVEFVNYLVEKNVVN